MRRWWGPWLFWTLAVGAVGASMLIEAPARLGFTPCIFRNVTGLPCPGCGMTRGFVAMGHGRVAEAWGVNLLAPAFFALCCAYVVWLPLSTLWPAVRWRRPSDGVRRAFLAVVLVLIAASWALSLRRHFAAEPRAAPSASRQVSDDGRS